MDESLALVVEDLLRDVAQQEVLSRFGRLGEGDVRHKDKSRDTRRADLVTTADLEAENRIREGLFKLMPDAAVVGEEDAFKSPEILDRLGESKPVWVVDPIDGTRNFAHGKPCFAIMCALIEGGETQMGWILDPVSGMCATAALGAGAFVAGGRVHMQSPDGVESLRGSLGEHLQQRLNAKRKAGTEAVPGRFVRYHCVGREYMDLGLNKINFALYGGKMMPWDHAAGTLYVTEAGGYARTLGEKQAYSPHHFGYGERLLIAPDEAHFDAIAGLLKAEKGEVSRK